LPLESPPTLTTPHARDIELFYDSIAEEFDRIMNRYDLRRRLETVFDELLAPFDLRGQNLLDAGCGTGWFSLWACQRGAEVTSVDIGPRLLAQVRRKCNARTMLADVLDLQYADGTFDVVVSSECIEHTRDPRRAVRELVRVCRPGGLVVITSNNRAWWWLCHLANRLHLRPYEGIENWPTWNQLREWVEQENAAVLDMRGIHLFPFQISLLHPVLRFLDRFGRFLGPFCVNQAVLATKRC
jgi:2-polyprenyl-3-methyl-5-hydroxy-6-metoxy-1,4-benzoquinol methylase